MIDFVVVRLSRDDDAWRHHLTDASKNLAMLNIPKYDALYMYMNGLL